MPELRETKQYKIAYEMLIPLLSDFNLSEEELDSYIYLLIDDIRQEIENTGKLPSYAFGMNINLPILYEHEEEQFLEVMCTFDPLDEYLDDIIIDNSFLLPSSASGRLNLTTGEYDSVLSWKEYFIEK
ncbi:MAG: hypothetical protein RBT33_02520 [Candidatus Dojkabacteria bacterium]|jgi:hypothetical protein|nr:hypothetical protein [Candidatus Dojkabacteria bacterium]